MKKIVAIGVIFSLGACSSPEIVYKPVTIEKPVPVPCHVPAVPEPAWPTSGITAKNSLFEQVRAALAELDVRRGYEASLKASVKACE